MPVQDPHTGRVRGSLRGGHDVSRSGPDAHPGQLRCDRDAEGNCVKVHICTKDYRTPNNDDCLAPIEERAWSSPIYVNYAGGR